MAEEDPDGISEILLSLQTNNGDSETLLPTLTLYTGERIYSDPKPHINLQLSLGGTYGENSNATAHVHESAVADNLAPFAVANNLAPFAVADNLAPFAVADNLAPFAVADNSSMMKRSYLEQNKMAQTDQEEIILINNIQGITGGKQKSKERDAIDPEWAAQSASENPALLRALKIIRYEANRQRAATRTKADHDQCDTSDKSHAIQDVAWQPEFVFQALEPGNSNNLDDFLSISPSKCAVNVDIGLTIPSKKPANETSVTSSMIPPAPMDVSRFTANAELLPPENLAVPILFPTASDKGKSVMVDEPSESATLSAPVTYYGTSVDGHLMTNFSGSISGPVAFATASSSIRSTLSMPQGAIERENSAPSTLVSNSQAAIQMANPVPPFMAASSSKENAISDLMHYDPYMAPAANANSLPAASALASNPWANASIPLAVHIHGAKTDDGSNAVIPPEPAKEHPLKRDVYLPDSQIELIRNMPTVATNGGNPDGRRIEGFLYQYSKYEEVVIVCICHGGFFTPREFVMHAGGGEVENPMKLITIVPAD